MHTYYVLFVLFHWYFHSMPSIVNYLPLDYSIAIRMTLLTIED
nr:MAG TPA: hypothetical protein [Caudoviricetes sp.]